jgi:tetratricopeptide (TPR) repeat protein
MSEESVQNVTEKMEVDEKQEEPEKQEQEQEQEQGQDEEKPETEQDQEDPSSPSADSETDSNDEATASTDADDSESAPKEDPIDLIARAVSHKDEGNDLFKAGDLTKASRYYRKGTSLLKNLNSGNTGDEQVKALLVSLQTNLSMVCFKQNKYQQSRDVASKVLDVESTNVKALYRRAVASRKIGDPDAAKKDLKRALQHDPNNRAVKKELIVIKKELEKEKQSKKAALAKAFSGKGSSFLYDDKEELEQIRAAEKAAKKEAEEKAKGKRKADWEDECVKRMSSGGEAISFEDYEKDLKKKEEDAEKEKKKLEKKEDERKRVERQAVKEATKKEKEESDSSDDELTEKEMQMLRGYKKTSDGRTTSYFSREQTEEEKKLLGNIAPQRLNAASAPPQRLESTTSVSSGKSSSAWNQAGTWEEKDTSEWCNSSLTSYLKEASVEIDHFTARVNEVKDLFGDASVAFVSGKKRYVFDYNTVINYVILDEGDDELASGTLKLHDISSTAISDELEVDVMAWKKAPNEANIDIAHKCRDALVNQIRSQVLAFVSAFNAQY